MLTHTCCVTLDSEVTSLVITIAPSSWWCPETHAKARGLGQALGHTELVATITEQRRLWKLHWVKGEEGREVNENVRGRVTYLLTIQAREGQSALTKHRCKYCITLKLSPSVGQTTDFFLCKYNVLYFPLSGTRS